MYGVRRLRASASEARVAGMGKGDFDIYPCLFGGDFPSGGILLGLRKFREIGGDNNALAWLPLVCRAAFGECARQSAAGERRLRALRRSARGAEGIDARRKPRLPQKEY